MEYFSGTKKLLDFIIADWKLLLILTLIFVIYFYYARTFDYFEKKGIKYMKPIIFLGSLGPIITAKKSFHCYQYEIYNYFKGNPYGGLFEGSQPVLYILDPELIKAITIRDFDHFVDRSIMNSNKPRYLKQSLLNLKGPEWKGVRSTLTPTFSSSRLRNMLPLIQHCSQQMVEFLKQYDNKDVEMKDTMGHFTLEVIGACAFGIRCDALTDENAHFVKVAEKFNYMPRLKRLCIFFFLVFMPKMLRFFNISFFYPKSIEELLRILKVAKSERKLSGTKKNDFLQLVIDAAEKEKSDPERPNKYLDDDTIDAQSLLFLIAGYETSSTLLSFALHVLATKPELQTKLREHIEEMTDGKEMSYELLSQLDYLEGFLLETLRRYPPVGRVERVCTKNYTLPGTSVQVQTGEIVALPIYGIHMDPDYYPDPEEIRPERFMGEEKKNRPSHLFLAFGVGPRNCIGLRFAMFSAKMAMVALMKNFKFSVCDKTEDPIHFDKRSMLLKTGKGLWVRLEKI
ncbi:cytochrome P450 9e2-like isoform X2 [Ostrinia furnacalis]|uniref:cytochrome P450 9e2-like isoform X2 n=1 Tax=Ostrinia furnacalis TaxID=93504 RepID=UPI00103C1969|nr:cytochrome P450 9e2-like isoform X2 [Ostrinia furnacalis]